MKKREEETGMFRDPCYEIGRFKGKGCVKVSGLWV